MHELPVSATVAQLDDATADMDDDGRPEQTITDDKDHDHIDI